MTTTGSTSRPATSLSRYRPLLAHGARHKGGWALIMLVTVAGTLVSLAVPLPLEVLVDNVLGHEAMGHVLAALPGAATPGTLLVWVVAAGLGLFAAGSALEVLSTYLWIRVGQAMVFEQARDIFAALQRRSLLFHSRASVGDTMGRVTDDSWVVHSLAEHVVLGPLRAGLMIAGVLFAMSRIDTGLTVVVAVVVPAAAASSLLFGRRIRGAAQDRRQVESRIQSHVQQTLAGIPVVQGYAQEDRHRSTFRALAAVAIGTQKRGAAAGSLNELGSGLVGVVGAGVVLWAGALAVIHGRLTTGALLAFIAYLAMLQVQLDEFTGVYRTLAEASAKVNRVLEVLDAEPEVADRRGATVLPPVAGHVRIEKVSFGYDAGRPVLREVSLEARPGEVVAIVGATGAGKSTLVGLVPRFFDPQGGRVSIDGHDVRDVTLASLRSQISLVLQDSFLFPVSVAANIAYGRPEASRAEVEAAARAANAHGFVVALPDGYDTVLGERGATLSGGERQRLSIARALLKDAPILILDEPTSALDAATESLLLDALRRLMAGRTTLIIAHRLSTIRDADRIVVLDGGAVAEAGTHHQLMARAGRYANLQRRQAGPATDATAAS